LTPPGLEPASLVGVLEQHFKQQRFSSPLQQPGAKLTENGKVEAEILSLSTQGLFPINPRPDGMGCLSL
jgi:hypothetical protein